MTSHKGKKMNTQKNLMITAGLEILTLGLILAMVFVSGFEQAADYSMYELLGVNLAVIMTTYGIYKMRRLT